MHAQMAFSSIVLFVVFFVPLIYCEDYRWINTAGTAQWSEGTNWSPTGIPGASDTVTVKSTSNNTIDLVSSQIIIKGLTIEVGSAIRIMSGSITVTGSTSIGGGWLDRISLTTQTSTSINGTLNMYDSSWISSNTIVGGTQPSIIMTGTCIFTNPASSSFTTTIGSVFTMKSTNSGDYSITKLINRGTMILAGATIGVCLTNDAGSSLTIVGTVTIAGEKQSSTPSQLQGSWDGSVTLTNNSNLYVYGGQHVFQPNVNLVQQGITQLFFTGYDSVNGGLSNVTFKLAHNFPYVGFNKYVCVDFSYATQIDNLVWGGGCITSNTALNRGQPAPLIFVKLLTYIFAWPSSVWAPNVFTNITIQDAPEMWGRMDLANGAVVTAVGTWTMSYTFMYPSGDSSSGIPGTLRVAPGGSITFRGANPSRNPHTLNVFFVNDGIVNTANPLTGTCIGAYQNSVVEFGYGGKHTGTWNIINCGYRGSSVLNYDIRFIASSLSSHTFLDGTEFTGPGSVYFGSTVNLQFSNPFTFKTNEVKVGGQSLSSQSEIHFTYLAAASSYLSPLPTGTPVTYYMDNTINTHTITGYGSSFFVYSGATLINNGLFDVTTKALLGSIGGGKYINNGNTSALSDQSWVRSSSYRANFYNNNGLAISAAVHANLWNRGDITLPLSVDSFSNEKVQFTGAVNLASNSTVYVNVFSNLAYDILNFTASAQCTFGGTLAVKFVRYSPTVGEIYPIILTAPFTNCPISCSGQFLSVVGLGLSSNLALGLLYDQTYSGSSSSVYVQVCDSSNATCIAGNTRNIPLSCSTTTTITTITTTAKAASSTTTVSGASTTSTKSSTTLQSSSSLSTSTTKDASTTSQSTSPQSTSSRATSSPTASQPTSSKSTSSQSTSLKSTSSSTTAPTSTPPTTPPATSADLPAGDQSENEGAMVGTSIFILIACFLLQF